MAEKLITKCCICGNEVETKKILSYRDFLGLGVDTYNMHIASCDNCGFIFQQNPLNATQLENYYKNISKYEFDTGDNPYNEYYNYTHYCLRQKHFIDENISTATGGYESILEIGAASGYNLSLYEGKRRLGIEPSALNCKLAKKNYGVDMFNGMWSEFLASDQKETYDLIFMSHVLEHIVNPMQFIKECASVCNRYMFIEVPCFDIKFLEEPFGMFCEEHVNTFTIQSLWNLMKKAGFAPVEFEINFGVHELIIAGYPAISTIWKKSSDFKVPVYRSFDCLGRYWQENEILLQAVREKINRIPAGEKLALWGIAHHVGMLLANTSLPEKNIVRMYDSDKRKHGIKVMGLPIQPFNIEDVLSGEVESILITSYTAQKAISRAIDKMNLPCKVYKLYDI